MAISFHTPIIETGEVVADEPTYYYAPDPNRPHLYERAAHSASRPFCATYLCPCHHVDQANIRRLVDMERHGDLTREQTRAIFYGKAPMPDARGS